MDIGLPLAERQWSLLFVLTLLYATERADRYRWRGTYGGVLPDGYDPNSLTAEACRQFLEGRRPQPPYHTKAQLRATARELRRLVRNQISTLHHRKENHLLRNEPDIPAVALDDRELIHPIETIAHPGQDPAALLRLKEPQAQVEQFRRFLGRDRRLRNLFEYRYAGILSRDILAQKLRLAPKVIKNLCARLQRRYLEFCRQSACKILPPA